MAYALTTPTSSRARSGVFSRIINWLAEASEAQARPLRRDIAELHSKSDRELADMGIRRDEIEIRVVGGRLHM